MSISDEEMEDTLSPEAIAQLLRLLVTAPRHRLSPAVIGGRAVWIKRFDAVRRPLAKRVHDRVSPLLPVFLRASPACDAAGLARREARKAVAFADAGIATPATLWRSAGVLVLSEVAAIGEPMLDRLRDADPVRHDRMLVEMAAALGRVHAAGLCHGRPHPRDMFRLDDGGWGFLDFEEEPEAAMPLAAAQARDIWLLFMQIAGRALDARTCDRAFRAWLAAAPADILPQLRRVVAAFSRLLPGLRFLRPLGLGSDGHRLLAALVFLRDALRDAKHPGPARPAAPSTPQRIGTPI